MEIIKEPVKTYKLKLKCKFCNNGEFEIDDDRLLSTKTKYTFPLKCNNCNKIIYSKQIFPKVVYLTEEEEKSFNNEYDESNFVEETKLNMKGNKS